MDGTAVTAIAKLANDARPIRVDETGAAFSRVALHHLPPDCTPNPLKVSTLDALVMYLVENRDCLELDDLVVHVESPTRVCVLSPLRAERNDRQREVYVVAETEDLVADIVGGLHRAPTHMTLEELQVVLRSRFVDNAHRRELLQLFSQVKSDSEVGVTDDGAAQTVTTKRGVAVWNEAGAKIPVPATLQPFRTFRELTQPESPFLVRLPRGGTITVTLFEVDGGAWQLEAIASVREYLVRALVADDSTAGIAVLA